MKKLRLDLEHLDVESFDTAAEPERRPGTVRANLLAVCPCCCCYPCCCTVGGTFDRTCPKTCAVSCDGTCYDSCYGTCGDSCGTCNWPCDPSYDKIC